MARLALSGSCFDPDEVHAESVHFYNRTTRRCS